MSNEPNTPYPFPQPTGPQYRRPNDPMRLCKRSAILMFSLGMLIALYSILNFTVIYSTPAEEMMRMQREGLGDLGKQPQVVSAETTRIMGLVLSALVIAVGLTMMVLASFVKRGRKGGVMAAMVVTGLVGAAVGAFMLISAFVGMVAPAMFAMVCMLCIPFSFSLWLFIWLFQSYKALVAASPTGVMPHGFPMQQGYGTPPAYPQQPAYYQPPPGLVAPPPAPIAPPPPGPMFGPAPFGIPPPPDESTGKYGYATKPPPANPPASDAIPEEPRS